MYHFITGNTKSATIGVIDKMSPVIVPLTPSYIARRGKNIGKLVRARSYQRMPPL
jgi:hypothetical protein